MKRILSCLAALAAVVAFALVGPAAAHNMEVKNPQTGDTIQENWVGGPLLPEQAAGEGLFKGHPSGLSQPAGHNAGLVKACSATESSPAVTILAPPRYTTCVHGNP
jgi:hypothetical protein